MCVIIDANIASDVFGKNGPESTKELYNRIKSETLKFVVGGKLRQELDRVSTYVQDVIRQALIAGNCISVNNAEIDKKIQQITKAQRFTSNDQHIIALAQVSGARLLCSYDKDLHEDFKNKELIDNPRGRIYPASEAADQTFGKKHRDLLNRTDLCKLR